LFVHYKTGKPIASDDIFRFKKHDLSYTHPQGTEVSRCCHGTQVDLSLRGKNRNWRQEPEEKKQNIITVLDPDTDSTIGE
jgi:hypothetical protein